ncbi:MAG: hypothetical protein H8D80_01995 [Proteobacteria bacterium]|nr:hypothetical protein [Pseudomonadota bacterium]
MIQPNWDQLSESTQRRINTPNQVQLREAYAAGYRQALNEDTTGMSGVSTAKFFNTPMTSIGRSVGGYREAKPVPQRKPYGYDPVWRDSDNDATDVIHLIDLLLQGQLKRPTRPTGWMGIDGYHPGPGERQA